MTTEAVRNDRRNGSLDSTRWRRRPAPAAAEPRDLFTDAAPSGLERAVDKISRVQGPRRVLQQLRALIIRNHRSLVTRCSTAEERHWSQRVHAILDELIREGDAVLPDAPTPRRIRCRARKS